MTSTILVIDDSEDDQRLYQRAFRDFDCFKLVMASSSEAGFARIADGGPDSKRPDLILLDYNLPDLDGLGFMKRLAEYSDTFIPIVMLTGEGNAAVAVEAMKNGADDYLVKDTEGRYLKLLPGVAGRVMAAHAQREQIKRLRQETEALLLRNQALMHNSMDGIHVMDMRGNIVEANDAFCHMLGYSREEMACLNVADWDVQWSAEELRERFKELIGKSARFETVHRRKDGALINVEVSTSGMEIEERYFLFAASRDITERKRATELLRNSVKEIEDLYNHAPCGYHSLDKNGIICKINDTELAWMGYTRDEVIGRLMWPDLITPASQQTFRENFPQLKKHGFVHDLEIEIIRKDGTVFIGLINATAIYNSRGDFVMSRSTVFDITERKRAEGVLKLNKTIIETAYDGFWLFDTNGYLLDVNQAYANMVGYAREEMVGMHISRLSAQNNTPELVKARLGMTIAQGPGNFETQHRHKDGHVVDFDASISYIPEAQCFFSFIRDVTERKKTEAALRRHKSVIDTSIDGFWMTDATCNLQEANEAYAKMSGYSVDELVNMHISQLEAKERSAEEVKAHHAKIIAQGFDCFETRHRHKDGHEFDIEASVTYMAESQQCFVFCRDITERKRMQLKTEALLRRNQALMTSSMDGIHVLDMQGNLVEANEAFCRMLGYSREEVAGRNVADWAAEFSGAESRVRFDEHNGKSVMMETLHHRKDGALINVEISIAREEIDGQSLLLCSSRDITVRKKAEKEMLRGSESDRKRAQALAQQFGHLLQSSFNEIYLFDAHSLRFLQTSAGAQKNLGYSADELEQLTPLDLKPYLTHESFESLMAPLRRGEQQALSFETFHRRKDGTTYPVEIRLQLMEADIPVFLAIIQDITERERAGASLRKSSEEIEDLYNHAACGYHSLDKDGIIRRINDTELAWLGYTRDEVIGKMKWTDVLTPISIKIFQEGFPRLMKYGFAYGIEVEIIRKDGTLLDGLVNATAIYDPSGNFVMTRSTLADITGRKHAERQTRELAAHLQTVREEEKASVAREVHDDLGGTLAALKMDAYWLAQKLAAENETAPLRERAEAMSSLLDNAIGVVRRVITDLRPTILDDLGLLATLKWQSAQFRKRTGIECRAVCTCSEDSGCEGVLDGALSINLFRIFQEALTNVARHSGASRVEVELHRDDKEVVLSVSDNGHGLPEGHTVASTSYGIRGMRERVVQLGGKIRFDTPPDGGFSVIVVLPLPGHPM